jgi:hypothetical protein
VVSGADPDCSGQYWLLPAAPGADREWRRAETEGGEVWFLWRAGGRWWLGEERQRGKEEGYRRSGAFSSPPQSGWEFYNSSPHPSLRVAKGCLPACGPLRVRARDPANEKELAAWLGDYTAESGRWSDGRQVGSHAPGTCHLSLQVFRAGAYTLLSEGAFWIIQGPEGKTAKPVGDPVVHSCPGAASAAYSDCPFWVECATHRK